jgi:hypothetical protein
MNFRRSKPKSDSGDFVVASGDTYRSCPGGRQVDDRFLERVVVRIELFFWNVPTSMRTHALPDLQQNVADEMERLVGRLAGG